MASLEQLKVRNLAASLKAVRCYCLAEPWGQELGQSVCSSICSFGLSYEWSLQPNDFQAALHETNWSADWFVVRINPKSPHNVET